MTASPSPILPENPFCSQRIRPGGIAYLFPPDRDATQWIERLRGTGWWGEVVGPHGSGKSALLAALVPAIERAGRRPVVVVLHDGQRKLPLTLRPAATIDASTVLVVDGYEQLGRWHRGQAKRVCRRLGMGLVASTHRSVGLPGLARTAATVELAQQIVERLQRDYVPRVTRSDVAMRFHDCGGNLRELFFDLYDLYEHRRRENASG